MNTDTDINSTIKGIQNRLKLLEDKQALYELLDEYCKAPDRRDFEGHANTYAAPMDNNNMAHGGPFKIDGDTATGSSYLIMVIIRDGQKRTDTLWQGGPYEWTFVRTESGWHIQTMKLQATWMNRDDPLGVFSTAMKG
ncbi:hypothetical protein PENSTE_c031G03293 [Penicillium steckii]|uniref:SnoaL-like domain-containing protein n=1 Tax=Penicillium steckii TaxID=303698 RepID=A0A1V6SN09_9EURO|nr:hypothetical protein PENSTE_c031G03293 [Penicillium steckii]